MTKEEEIKAAEKLLIENGFMVLKLDALPTLGDPLVLNQPLPTIPPTYWIECDHLACECGCGHCTCGQVGGPCKCPKKDK